MSELNSNDAKSRASGNLTIWILLLVVVVVVAIAVIIIPITSGIHRSGDLAVGDGIVGGGTLLLAAATVWLALGTYRVDQRAAEREAERIDRENALRRHETQNIAVLLDAEISLSGETLTKIYETEMWKRGALLPRAAWDNYRDRIVSALTAEDTLKLVRYFEKLDAWTRVVAAHLQRWPDQYHMNTTQARDDLGEVDELAPLWNDAKTLASWLARGGRREE